MCNQSAPISIICAASSASLAKSHDSRDGQMMGLRRGTTIFQLLLEQLLVLVKESVTPLSGCARCEIL
jgi:hypothetical protein